jgi:hypothetical protein
VDVSTYEGPVTDEFGVSHFSFPIESVIKIKNAKTYLAGDFKCVVVDLNGVPSWSSTSEYDGVVKLHVREAFWLYIPIGALVFIFIVMILIEVFSPLRMEHEDGKVFTKEELQKSENSKQEEAGNTHSEKSEVTEVDVFQRTAISKPSAPNNTSSDGDNRGNKES